MSPEDAPDQFQHKSRRDRRHILETLVCYRLIDPGSEWRLHRLWFEQSAMGDLLGEDFALDGASFFREGQASDFAHIWGCEG